MIINSKKILMDKVMPRQSYEISFIKVKAKKQTLYSSFEKSFPLEKFSPFVFLKNI